MAEVFRGTRLGAHGFERTVAIKRILPGLAQDERFVRMFIREALILSRLVHPNIVNALGFERDPNGQLCLVLEIVDGVNLADLVKSGPLPNAMTVFIVGQILLGLAHAHQLPLGGGALGLDVRGVVHRDLSPHNILLSWDGSVKVTDFGIAKARIGSRVSASRDFHGKVAYMSPEQINGAPLDGRSDLFAVGIMMWEMLTGGRLFQAESTGAIMWRVLTDSIVRPSLLRSVPADLEAVAMRLLERNPARRYCSAEAAFEALASCADTSGHGRFQLERLLAQRFPEKALRRHPPSLAMKMPAALLVPAPAACGRTMTSPMHPGDRATLGAAVRRWLCRWWPTIEIMMSLALAGAVLPASVNTM